MSQQETNLTFGLDGGIVTTALDEVVQLPSLLQSDNTRLSVIRGTVSAAPAPETIATLDAGAECAGIVPAGRVDSSVGFFNQAGGNNQRIAGTERRVLSSVLQPAATLNGYRPAEIARANVINGVLELRTPAVCVHPVNGSNLRVFASMRYTAEPGEVGVYVTAIDEAGRVVIAPQFAFALGTEGTPLILFHTLWVGLTSHGVNDIRCWYTKDDNKVHRRTLTISGLSLTVGAEVDHSTTLVFAPTILEVVRMDDTTAFLLHCKTGLTETWLDKVDVVADTYAREILASPASGMVSMAYVDTALPYVAVNYRIAAGNDWFRSLWRADTFVNVWNQTENPGVTPQLVESAVQFYVQPDGVAFGVFVLSRQGSLPALHDGSGDSDDPSFLLFRCVRLDSGATVGQARRNWMRLADRGATMPLGPLERLPLFTLTRDYKFRDSPNAESAGYVPDPSRELYSVVRGLPGTFLLHITPVARYGVDTAARLTFVSGPSPCAVDGRRVICVYQTETFEFATHLYTSVARYVEVDFTARQPRYALDRGGVALIAAAQPATWDGREVVEAGPLHVPKLVAYDDGGTGDALVSTYLFRAVISWRDAAGQIHRSSPSPECKVVGTDGAPVTPRVYVTVPDTLRDGISQELYSVTLYQAGPITSDDPALPASSVYFSRRDYEPTTDGIVWAFTEIAEGPSSYAETILYTTGQGDEELPAEAAPPLWDVASVGPRLWGVHGEIRRRAVYTKKHVDGYAPEWNAGLLVDMPAAAGNLVAVAELDGKPLLLAQNGIYTLDGEGPDNAGQGDYGDPRCVASVACSSRESVVRFPGGVLFQSGVRMAMMQAGGAVRFLDEIDTAPITFVAAIVLPREQEVVFSVRSSTNGHALVYNYVLDRWTRWLTFPRLSALTLGSATRALAFAPNTRELVFVDVDLSRADSIALKTGWVMPAGPQGDANIREVILQGLHVGDFSLRVLVRQDFDERADAENVGVDITYDAGQIAEARNGTQRYTLRVALDHTISRAFELFLLATRDPDTTERNFFRPLAVTVPMGVNPGELRRHVAAGMK
jgi:hypothetical protein